MEPTPEGAGTGAGTGERDVELTELTPTAVRRHPTRVAFATLGAIVLLAAAVGTLAARRDHNAPPLVLVPGGRSAATAAALPSGELFPSFGPLEYRLAITPPDLGSTAPVARL